MNKELFNQLMHRPHDLSQQDAQVLQELIHQFPYFQTAHLLYLKGLHNENSIHFDKQLKVAAAYSGDRKVLYQLIHQPAEKGRVTTELPAINSGKEEEIIRNKEVDIHTSSLDKMMREEAISASVIYNIEQLEEQQQEEKEEELIEQKENPEKTIDFNSNHSFSDWLKLSGGGQSKKSKSLDLIEKFIEETPKMPKPEAKFFSPVNFAKRSVSDADDALITETLAKIYFDQGNLPKALKAYQALILKHPEKKAIFAARIKTIKKLINQK